jgi:large subunit ribosomal protein L7/L12
LKRCGVEIFNHLIVISRKSLFIIYVTVMELSKNVQSVFDVIKGLSAVELNELVKGLEEEFGVSAAAGAVVVAGAAGWDADAAVASDTVNVELTEIGQQKINVIKVVKETMGLGLKEAKDLVEKAPTIIKENVKSEEAESLKVKLQEAGATVNFK